METQLVVGGGPHEESAERAAERVTRAGAGAGRAAQDFSSVRVHAGGRARDAAEAVGARAYTVGDDIVLGEQDAQDSLEGRRLIAHELAHVVQQRATGPRLMRAPLPNVTEPRTFIVVYGSGQLNPTTNDHNVGALFRMVAAQKVAEIKGRLGKNVAKHTIVFEYTPTEAELKTVLNKKYAAPVAEVHLFSHGWQEGANLGGPIPPDVKHRPTETPEDADQRRLKKGDLGSYDIDFADDAAVTFYGCNIGNVQGADAGRPFAREFSEEFGVAVTASTRATHFTSSGGWHQVPDTGGKMEDFTPSPMTARAEVGRFKQLLLDRKAKRNELAKPTAKGGLIGTMLRQDRVVQAIGALQARIAQKRPLVRRLLRFLPAAEAADAEKDMKAAEAP
jgi:hypothetical protein